MPRVAPPRPEKTARPHNGSMAWGARCAHGTLHLPAACYLTCWMSHRFLGSLCMLRMCVDVLYATSAPAELEEEIHNVSRKLHVLLFTEVAPLVPSGILSGRRVPGRGRSLSFIIIIIIISSSSSSAAALLLLSMLSLLLVSYVEYV